MNVGFPSFRMPVSFCDNVISESPAPDIASVKERAEKRAGEVLQLVRLLEKTGKLTPENFLAGVKRFEEVTLEQFTDSSVKWGIGDNGNVFLAFCYTEEEGEMSEETGHEFFPKAKSSPERAEIGGGFARSQVYRIRGALKQMDKLETLINEGSMIFQVSPSLGKKITLTLFKP